MANYLPPSLKNYCKASNLAFNEEVRITLPLHRECDDLYKTASRSSRCEKREKRCTTWPSGRVRFQFPKALLMPWREVLTSMTIFRLQVIHVDIHFSIKWFKNLCVRFARLKRSGGRIPSRRRYARLRGGRHPHRPRIEDAPVPHNETLPWRWD